MATNKSAPEEAPEVAAAPATDPITVTLNEFCIRLSETITRPELIGGFAHTERAAGHLRDTTDAFQARYEAFINKPV